MTGGSGYFGSILAGMALERGDRVRVFDLNPPVPRPGIEYIGGDVRDRAAVTAACRGADVVLHNVAQVPLARDRDLFWSVNVTGTANVLLAARDCRVAKVVHTSSSAIFGIPERNPVTEDTPGRPLEAYGKAKLEAELLCRDAAEGGVDVTIVRPRTILGHGRLGIVAVLFEFVAEGAPVYVLGRGDNRYQFVHANDLADACLRAAGREKPAVYNIGAGEFGTMRETLQALVEHAGTGSRVRSSAGRRRSGGDADVVEGGCRPLRALPLAALRRVPVVRHQQGPDGARLGAPVLQRVRRDRVLRLVPGPSRRTGDGAALPPPVAGRAGPAGGPQAPAMRPLPGEMGSQPRPSDPLT